MNSGVAIPMGQGKTLVLKKTPANVKLIDQFRRLADKKQWKTVAGKVGAFDIKLECRNNTGPLRIGSMEKPKGGDKPKGNRGDVGEGIFSAAIATRFLHKNSTITVAMVQDLIRMLKNAPGGSGSGGSKVKDLKTDSENANPKIHDHLHYHISLADINMTALLDSSLWKSFSDIFEGAVKYANSPTVVAWSKLLYENNQENEILVSSAGTEDQSGTKVDVRVKVDGKPTDINVSLKVGDVKQFGQVSGADISKMQTLFGPLGVNFDAVQGKFNKFLAQRKPERAMYVAYEAVRDQINKQMSGPASRALWLKKLGDFLVFHATRNEENVTLVQLNRRDAHIYDFSKVYNALSDLFVHCGLSDSAGKPKLVLTAGKGVLLEIRSKTDQKPDGSVYMRNYIEKGKLLSEMISQHAG
jgi:hypothetical protein